MIIYLLRTENMNYFIFIFNFLILFRFSYTDRFSKLFQQEKGFYDNGESIFSSDILPSASACATQCLTQTGCLAVVYQNESQICSFLISNQTLVETSDVRYSYIFIGDHCMTGWTEFNSSCYFFGNELYTWSNAVAAKQEIHGACKDGSYPMRLRTWRANLCHEYCKTHYATLVEIETASENVFLQASLSTKINPEHWIGLTDAAEEGRWLGSNGAVAEYFDWGWNQPNQGTAANCAGVWASFGYKWVDEPCGNLYYPICEKPTTSSP